MKDLHAELGNANSTQNRHEDELISIFDKLSVLQEGVLQNIRTVTERVDKMEASNLMGFTDQWLSQLEELAEKISDMEKDMISDCLRIYGLESRINTRYDELAIG